jgi:hypothetical protein
MFEVNTPRGAVQVTPRQMARASDRLHRLPPERRAHAAGKAHAVLSRRDSRRAAAIAAAAAALAALALPSAAV